MRIDGTDDFMSTGQTIRRSQYHEQLEATEAKSLRLFQEKCSRLAKEHGVEFDASKWYRDSAKWYKDHPEKTR